MVLKHRRSTIRFFGTVSHPTGAVSETGIYNAKNTKRMIDYIRTGQLTI